MGNDGGENWDDFFYMRDKDGSYQKVPLDHFGCNIPTLIVLVDGCRFSHLLRILGHRGVIA